MSALLSVFALAGTLLSQPSTTAAETHTPSVDLMTVFERGCLDSEGDMDRFVRINLPPASIAKRLSDSALKGLQKLDQDTKAAWIFRSPSGGVLLSFDSGGPVACIVGSASDVKSDDFFAAFDAMAKRHAGVASAPGIFEKDPKNLLSAYDTALSGRRASILANAERLPSGNYAVRIFLYLDTKLN